MTNRNSAVRLAMVAIIAVGGCIQSHEPVPPHISKPAFMSVDSWYSPPPAGIEFTAVPTANFALVVSGLQAEAQKELYGIATKRLTRAEADRLVGKQMALGSEYMLLRGVALNEATGMFEIGITGNKVLIRHGSLGKQPASMRRTAIVAVLPSVPETVFTSCSMAE